MNTTPVSTSSPNTIQSSKKQMKTEDFIKMMIVQLQHQDPMEPAKNQEIMAQMAQVSALESSAQLRSTLTGLATQNQIGAAGNLMGKVVQGLNADNDLIEGVVLAVRIDKDGAYLQLDNVAELPLENVTAIAPLEYVQAQQAKTN